ncbi:MAG: hypothetical protein M3443_01900 [Actinomycetota bacterium]|nr:hypothetical protein [Actinomycetota bacterium]
MTPKHIKVLIGVVVVVLVAVSAFFYFSGEKPVTVETGDCVRVEKDSTTLVKAGCDAPEAVFTVAKKVDGPYGDCPKPGHYVPYPPEDRYQAGQQTLCLMMNVKKGDCLSAITSVENARRVECAAAEFQVLGILEDKVDPYSCTDVDGTNSGFIYAEPPRVICGKSNAP